MNDPAQLDNQTLSRDCVYNNLLYLGKYYNVENGVDINYILADTKNGLKKAIMDYLGEGHTEKEAQKKYADDIRMLTVTQNAVSNDPELGNMVIANQTAQMDEPKTGMPYEEGGTVACTFQDSAENPSSVTFVYRGTNGGEWYDNGIGLSGQVVATPQQIRAQEYFDYIVETNNWDESQPDIHVTGHSKGGNLAQFTVMTSAYSDLITSAYSFDGQSMSPEALESMRELCGPEEYDRRRDKLYSISADNDYVNPLGADRQDGRLVPDDHIFYLESNLTGYKWHYADCYVNEDGTLTAFTEQGEFSKFVQEMSEQLMELPAPVRSVVTNGLMGIAETFLGNGRPVNGETISWAECGTSVAMLLEMVPAGVIGRKGEEWGVDLDWLANVVTAYELIYWTGINIRQYMGGKVVDQILEVRDKIIEFGNECKELTATVVAFIDEAVERLQGWYDRTFNEGYKYATANPLIILDTYKMRSYAQRIEAVNRRISNLDSRLDALYWKVGLLDLWNLVQADLLTSYSWRLLRCASYLNETASEFEDLEFNLLNTL